MKNNSGHVDWFILLPVLGLMLFSIAFVYSASATFAELNFGDSESLFLKHTVRIIAGIITVLVFSRIDYHYWQKFSKPILILGIIMLVWVLIGGSSYKGASRWLSLGPISFQPSEFVKFAMIIHFSALLAVKGKLIKDFEKGFLPFILWTGLICLLIAMQPNFSTMMVIFMIAIAMMFVGNTNIIHLGASAFLGVIAAVVYAVSAEYRLNRFKAFLGLGDGNTHETVSYQLNQALIALGNGGLFGVGAGQNRQSNLFLPESYGDFIFSIIGEEFGFIGIVLVIAAFAVIFWRGIIVARKAPDKFGYYLAAGIVITFAMYVFVNSGVNTGLLPTTGVPMPFVSYGGTAIIFYGAAMGALLNISAQAGVYPKDGENPEEEEITRPEETS